MQDNQAAPADLPESVQEPTTALILDDSEAERYRLKKLCQNAGLDLEYHEADTIERFKECLDQRRYDIVFIDYHLGMATGQEALEATRAHPDHGAAVAIMVTSVNRHDVIIEAMRAGCSDYLIKEELTVDAIRKSVATAYEKRLLHALISAERREVQTLRASISRFATSLSPEMQRVLSAMLWRVRSCGAPQAEHQVGDFREELESLCIEGLTILGGGLHPPVAGDGGESPKQIARPARPAAVPQNGRIRPVRPSREEQCLERR